MVGAANATGRRRARARARLRPHRRLAEARVRPARGGAGCSPRVAAPSSARIPLASPWRSRSPATPSTPSAPTPSASSTRSSPDQVLDSPCVRRAHRRQRPARRRRRRSWSGSRHRPAPRPERLAELQACSAARTPRRGARLRREARAGLAGPMTRRAAGRRPVLRARGRGGRGARLAPLGPGQVRVRVAAAAVNFPDVLLVADTYQIRCRRRSCPAASSPAWSRGRRRGRRPAVGDRVRDRHWSAPSPRRRWWRPTSCAASRRGRRRDGRRLRGGPPHRLPRAPLGRRRCSRARSSSCSAPAAAWGWPPSSSASLLGASVTGGGVVGREARGAAGVRRAPPPHRPPRGDQRQALASAARGADVVVDPVGGDLAEPALRALRWGGRFVTVGYASGDIPRIPLNLVLLKGIRILGFEFFDFVHHCPTSSSATRTSWATCWRPGRSSPTSAPRSPRRRGRRAAATSPTAGPSARSSSGGGGGGGAVWRRSVAEFPPPTTGGRRRGGRVDGNPPTPV